MDINNYKPSILCICLKPKATISIIHTKVPWEDEQVLTHMRALNSRSVSVTLCLYSQLMALRWPPSQSQPTLHFALISCSSLHCSVSHTGPLPVPPSRSFLLTFNNNVPLAWLLYLRCPRGDALTTLGLCPEVTVSRFCLSSLCKNATTSHNQGRWIPSAALAFLHNRYPHWTYSLIVYCILPANRMSFKGRDLYLDCCNSGSWVFGVNWCGVNYLLVDAWTSYPS